LTGATWGLGTILGPAVGGAFAQIGKFGWRGAFYLNLPMGVLIIPILIFLVPPFDAKQGMPYKERIKQIDWVGSVLLSSMIAALFLGIIFGGNQFPWDSAPIIAAFGSFGLAHSEYFELTDFKASSLFFLYSANPLICRINPKRKECFLWKCFTCGQLCSYLSSPPLPAH
jgi:MFS family permease